MLTGGQLVLVEQQKSYCSDEQSLHRGGAIQREMTCSQRAVAEGQRGAHWESASRNYFRCKMWICLQLGTLLRFVYGHIDCHWLSAKWHRRKRSKGLCCVYPPRVQTCYHRVGSKPRFLQLKEGDHTTWVQAIQLLKTYSTIWPSF